MYKLTCKEICTKICNYIQLSLSDINTKLLLQKLFIISDKDSSLINRSSSITSNSTKMESNTSVKSINQPSKYDIDDNKENANKSLKLSIKNKAYTLSEKKYNQKEDSNIYHNKSNINLEKSQFFVEFRPTNNYKHINDNIYKAKLIPENYCLNDYQQNPIFHMHTIMLYSYLNNLLTKFAFCPNERFLYKLNTDLNRFICQLENKNMKLNPIKNNIYNYIKSISKDIVQFKSYEPVYFELYGSFATGLSIDTSDIDVVIIYKNEENMVDYFINELSKLYGETNKFIRVYPIFSAKVPVIKLIYKITENDSIYYNNINTDEIKIDITFHNTYINNIFPALNTVKYVKNALELFKLTKNVILFIKKYLSKLDLNSYYLGGLSSYSIFILLISLVLLKKNQYTLNQNYQSAQLLLCFLEFYSKFDFTKCGINLNANIPYFLLPNSPSPVILDPTTCLNIGIGSYRIKEVQQSFLNLIVNMRNKYNEMSNRNKKESLLSEYE